MGGAVSIVVGDDGLTTDQLNALDSPRGNMTMKFLRTEFLENKISVEISGTVGTPRVLHAFGAG